MRIVNQTGRLTWMSLMSRRARLANEIANLCQTLDGVESQETPLIEDRHPIAGLEAQGSQPEGRAAHPRQKLPVRDGPPVVRAGPIPDGIDGVDSRPPMIQTPTAQTTAGANASALRAIDRLRPPCAEPGAAEP